MEYVFGTKGEMEILKTKGSAHTSLTGYRQIERSYPDQTITDVFRVVRRLDSGEDGEGNCYDWYEIDRHYRTTDRSGPVEAAAKSAESTAALTFVVMAEAGQIDPVTAGEHGELFAPWAERVTYQAGNIRRYGEALYRCTQGHTSQADWTPETAGSLWTRITDPAEEWPEWSAPVGAHDAYQSGDQVSRGGKRWISETDGNVWEPGVYGWTEAAQSGEA